MLSEIKSRYNIKSIILVTQVWIIEDWGKQGEVKRETDREIKRSWNLKRKVY